MTDVFIRASSLSGYADCPRRAAAKIFAAAVKEMGFELRQIPSSIGASIGTAVHTGMATTLMHKAETGELAPEDATTDEVIASLRDRAAEGVLFDRETPELNTAEQQALRMTRVYRSTVAPQIEPILVERRLEAEVKPGLILTGQSDVIAREPGKVRDLKTGNKMGNHAPQIGAYSLLARSTGVEINAACIDFVQRVSMKKPQPDAISSPVEVIRAETAAINVIRRMDHDLQVFTAGDHEQGLAAGDPWAFLANPSSMLCSAKWCPAHGTPFCTEHAKIEEETV
jgi:hypothetical protein